MKGKIKNMFYDNLLKNVLLLRYFIFFFINFILKIIINFFYLRFKYFIKKNYKYLLLLLQFLIIITLDFRKEIQESFLYFKMEK